jgi:hypothetical protein
MAARWTCLSYTWGPRDRATNRTILLNGLPFEVRANLHDFLELLQSSLRINTSVYEISQEPYWIDALSIDQRNARERNHQVEQMGQIFAEADFVHIWLGKASDTDGISQVLRGSPQNGDWRVNLERYKHTLCRHLFGNAFWDRAWVTQEVALAKFLRVSLGPQLFQYHELFRHADELASLRAKTSFNQFDPTKTGHLFVSSSCVDHCNTSVQPEHSLPYLLNHFSSKRCSVLHDRIYSLLSICGKQYKVPVNYNTSLVELAIQVMSCHGEHLCICAAVAVAKSLGLCSTLLYAQHSEMGFGQLQLQLSIQTDLSTIFLPPNASGSLKPQSGSYSLSRLHEYRSTMMEARKSCTIRLEHHFLNILATSQRLHRYLLENLADEDNQSLQQVCNGANGIQKFLLAPGWALTPDETNSSDLTVVKGCVTQFSKLIGNGGLCSSFCDKDAGSLLSSQV